MIRGFAWFQIGYGSLGLLSTILLAFVMPVNPLPRGAMIAGGAASAWIVFVGIVTLRYGPRILTGIRRWFGALLRRYGPPIVVGARRWYGALLRRGR